MISFEKFTHLTFDCYGTLIDWETGILDAVSRVLARHNVTASDEQLLQLYARREAAEEAGPYKPYRDVLRAVMKGMGQDLGFAASKTDRDALAFSPESWPPFPDSAEALARLKARYKLVILSNIDDAIFQETSRSLGDPFEFVITAEQVGSYKPSLTNFRHALHRLDVAAEQVLHVAQSLFHDHAPAKKLGLSTVWVNRASRCLGVGVAPPAERVVPDLEVPDMRTLADKAGV